MTAQFADVIKIDEEEYLILAIQNAWPFKPEDYALKLTGASSACWRGHQETYVLKERNLLLDTFIANLEYLASKQPPMIHQKSPRPPSDREAWIGNSVYDGLDWKMDYSGGVIIGKDFQRDFYLHMGFHRPHCFKVVYELKFEAGRLIEKIDHGAKMESVRQKIMLDRAGDCHNRPPDSEAINQWIKGCFSLDYSGKKDWA